MFNSFYKNIPYLTYTSVVNLEYKSRLNFVKQSDGNNSLDNLPQKTVASTRKFYPKKIF